MNLLRTAFIASALLVSGIAQAHPGHDLVSAGFIAGVVHPLLGLDHLLAMLMVGIWAAQIGGVARWLLPASFVTMMALGAAISLQGWQLPQIESGIAVSLLLLGILVTLAARLPIAAAMALTALFAVFHGAEHGAELPATANPQLYALGFLIATALLHGVGLLFASLRPTMAKLGARLAGGVAIATGVAAGLVQILA